MRSRAILAAAACVLAACATRRPATVEEPFGTAKALYSAKCQGCHRLYLPETIDRVKWPRLLDKMAVKAKLTPEQKTEIDAYLTSVAPK